MQTYRSIFGCLGWRIIFLGISEIIVWLRLSGSDQNFKKSNHISLDTHWGFKSSAPSSPELFLSSYHVAQFTHTYTCARSPSYSSPNSGRKPSTYPQNLWKKGQWSELGRGGKRRWMQLQWASVKVTDRERQGWIHFLQEEENFEAFSGKDQQCRTGQAEDVVAEDGAATGQLDMSRWGHTVLICS